MNTTSLQRELMNQIQFMTYEQQRQVLLYIQGIKSQAVQMENPHQLNMAELDSMQQVMDEEAETLLLGGY